MIFITQNTNLYQKLPLSSINLGIFFCKKKKKFFYDMQGLVEAKLTGMSDSLQEKAVNLALKDKEYTDHIFKKNPKTKLEFKNRIFYWQSLPMHPLKKMGVNFQEIIIVSNTNAYFKESIYEYRDALFDFYIDALTGFVIFPKEYYLRGELD